MRSELLLIEKIEQYLEGSLSKTEHAEFEKQIAADPLLQDEVTLQKQLMQGFERAAVKRDVVAAFVKYKKFAFLTKLGFIGGSAAVGTAVTVAVVSYTGNNNQQNLSDNNSSGITQTLLLDSTQTTTNDSISYEQALADTIQTNADGTTQLKTFDKNNSQLISSDNTSERIDASSAFNPENATPPIVADVNTEADSVPPTNITPPVTPASPPKKLNKRKKDTRLADLFWTKGTTLTWLGLDFTNAHLLGDFEEITNVDTKDKKIANKYFQSWNDVVMTEKGKYSFNDAFYNKHVFYYLDYVNKRNDSINAKRLFVYNSANLNHLTPPKIQQIVNGYDLGKRTGLGLVYIVESLDKQKQKSAVWATIIDMETKEVLLAERLTGRPVGSGLKSYWANSFRETIEFIESKKFNEWKKKYTK